MNAKYQSSEKGQAIVYITIGLVVFLGFVALAIDGGMALADRRHSQNAADAASLAGGGEAALSLENSQMFTDQWSCNDPRVKAAERIAVDKAIARAAANGFTIGEGMSNHNGVTTTCGPHGSDHNRYIDVTVDISSVTQSNFLQLIYPDALHNEVEAVTRVNPRRPVVLGNAIVALDPQLCQGAQTGAIFYGSGDSTINGGGVFTNGCLDGNGQPDVTINGGGFNYAGEVNLGNANWSPPPPADPVDKISISDYTIKFSASACTGHWVTNNDIDRNGNEIGPGLYCFHGNFTTQAHDVIVGHDVTFYVEGDITFNGNDLSDLEARRAEDKSTDGELPGVIIYVPHLAGQSCPDQVVKMNGTSGLVFSGIIYGPCADISLNGDTGIVTWLNQVIGWDVHVGGNATTVINYDKSKLLLFPTNIELFR